MLGEAMIPQSPSTIVPLFVQKLLALITEKFVPEPSREDAAKIMNENQGPLNVSATALFQADFEKQWEDIHRALYQLQLAKLSPQAAFSALEPPLSLSGVIVVWAFLSFPVPRILLFSAIAMMIIVSGVALFMSFVQYENYVNGATVQAFLFDRYLDKKDASGDHSRDSNSD